MTRNRKTSVFAFGALAFAALLALNPFPMASAADEQPAQPQAAAPAPAEVPAAAPAAAESQLPDMVLGKADAPVTIVGSRAAVRPRADDGRYWETAITARDGAGRLLAGAEITFVAVRGAARRLATGMLAVNDAAVLRRVFPAYIA